MLLITGASGHIGLRVAEPVAKAGVDLRLMTRTPAKVPQLAGVEAVSGSFARSDALTSAFRAAAKTGVQHTM